MHKYRPIIGKITFSLWIIAVYVLGKNVLIPWVEYESIPQTSSGMQEFINSVMGNDVGESSILALGVMPAMLGRMFVGLVHLLDRRKEKASARAISFQTGAAILAISIISSISKSTRMEFSSEYGLSRLQLEIMTVILLVAGELLIVWLIERNKTWGIGEQSLLMFANVIQRSEKKFLAAIFEFFGEYGHVRLWTAIIIISSLFVILSCIVLSESQIRIPLRRTMIHNSFSEDNYFSIKCSPSGTSAVVMVMLFFSVPYNISRFIARYTGDNFFLRLIAENMNLDHFSGLLIYLAIVFITNMVMAETRVDPAKTAKEFRENGNYLAGIRPGRATEQWIRHETRKLASFSSFVMCVIVAIPLAYKIYIGSDSNLFTLPITVMVVTSIIARMMDELHVINVLNRYENVEF